MQIARAERVTAWTRRVGARSLALTATLTLLASCQSAYYATMESFGQHKRDILVDRVEDARDDQEEAKEQFADALEAFMSVTAYDGGDLRDVYDRLSDELDRCEDKAARVRKRIDSIEEVSEDLFAEWSKELEQYSSDQFRQQSEAQLRDTRTRYDQLIGAMNRAEARMEPVLVVFRDQVLFLKHNLNAQAIASLQGNVAAIESDVSQLIAEMDVAIDEANAFIEGMG